MPQHEVSGSDQLVGHGDDVIALIISTIEVDDWIFARCASDADEIHREGTTEVDNIFCRSKAKKFLRTGMDLLSSKPLYVTKITTNDRNWKKCG